MPGPLLDAKYLSRGSSKKGMPLFFLDSGFEFCLPRVTISKRPQESGDPEESTQQTQSGAGAPFALRVCCYSEKRTADLAEPAGKGQGGRTTGQHRVLQHGL